MLSDSFYTGHKTKNCEQKKVFHFRRKEVSFFLKIVFVVTTDIYLSIIEKFTAMVIHLYRHQYL